MPKKQLGPRIGPQTEKWLEETFSARHPGAEYVLEMMPALYSRTLADLKGRFAQGELSLMIDVFNGTMLTSHIAGQHLTINCVDGMELDKLDEKWEVEKEKFIEKLKELTIFEAACLEIWANGFWYGGWHSGGTYETGEFEKYIEKLA